MAQQTAVEWFSEKLNELYGEDNPWFDIPLSMLEQAIAMEKEQLEQSCIEVAEEAKKILREELKEFIVLPKDWIYENNK